MTLRAVALALALCASSLPLACHHAEEKADKPATDSGPTSAAGAQTASAPVAASASSAVDEVSPCTSDADCGFTRVAEGGCCPMLCSPRVVTLKRASLLEKAVAACNKGAECPLPLCRPPLQESTPRCQQGKCVAKTRPVDPRVQ